MKKITYTYYIDPAHGYLQVPRSDVAELGHFKPSRYSYMDAENFYLEEDEDMTDFLRVFTAFHGDKPEIVEHHLDFDVLGSTWIRDLDTVL